MALLALGRRRTLGLVLLLMAVIPFGDAVTVLAHGGGYAEALGIHAATGVGVLLAAGLLFATSAPEAASARRPAPAV